MKFPGIVIAPKAEFEPDITIFSIDNDKKPLKTFFGGIVTGLITIIGLKLIIAHILRKKGK